jgi:lipid II:glycine glycyltransferase (peptidoglycan interpeptide bridge formation enzyme)
MSNSWNALIAQLPNPHFLQTYEWGQVKARYGWEPLYLVWYEDGKWALERDISKLAAAHAPVQAAALILKKSIIRRGLAARLCVLYAPKGPLLDWGDEALRERVLDDLQRFTRQQGAIFLKLDPDVVLGTGLPGTETAIAEPGGEAVRADLTRRGWRFSEDQIQFKNTVLLDVSLSEEEMLGRMKQKTRYNVRLGSKKGVSVRVGSEKDWPMLYKLYAETSVRDGFVIRDEGYYQTVWGLFASLAEPLIAEVEGQPVAAVFLFAFARRAYYVYGMSRDVHREKMPTYLLQWEAMKWAQARGCSLYDLWGAPDVFDESDSLWGVFRFKEGLGGWVVRTLGAWDFVPNSLWYAMYTQVVPMILDVMRARGKVRTRQGLGG